MKKVLSNHQYMSERSIFSDTLTVLVSEIEDGKAQVEYFVNGKQVADWGSIYVDYKDTFAAQMIFSSMADDLCEVENLIKWCY